ncbi:tyrosyl-DNA phosphodiesterase [Nitzschia inconspicua]|uniref:Tyrosyl-DNA phosphodiesterase n=1 Tax=Nitzschia inconspicua TaxID=303405 RepID=A0A9K3KCV4_9STRA|nr:tyrosyl-DNA phosphodiesterase [Nitzschia inconspicua]
MIPPSLRGVPFVELSYETQTDTDGNNVSQDSNNIKNSHYSRVRYWSDRFYLTTTSAEEADWSKTMTSTESSTNSCSCGHASPPPLFPRELFIKSLDVRAAIVGTYVWDPDWFAVTFPDLVNSVPTLVLHGHRGLFRRYDENNNTNQRGVIAGDGYQTDTDCSDTDTGTCSDRNNISGYHDNDNDADGDDHNENEQEDPSANFHPPPENISKRLHSRSSSSTIQMNYVRCTFWKKPVKDSSQFVSENIHTRNHRQQHQKQLVRETRRGVHHPKFWLLLEKSGSLVVMVTTANLTPIETVEGIWVQRFHPVRKQKRVGPSPSTNQPKNDNPHNDFGVVLQDFLTKLSQASQCSKMVDNFMARHFGCPLRQLSKRFHFHTAQVYLVPVVPGDHNGPTKTDDRRRNLRPGKQQQRQQQQRPFHYYGYHRVQYILKTFGRDTPRNSKRTKDRSKSDRLMLQPTSLGADWDRRTFASLVRGYMGYPRGDDDRNDDWVVRQADIVWPSDRQIAEWSGGTTLDDTIIPKIEDASNVLPQQQQQQQQQQQPRLETHDHSHSHRGGFLFNSSDTFNRCEVSVLSRMCQYHANVPQQRPSRVPHFKSVARVIRNHNAEIFLQTVRPGRAKSYFSWFLMTSACLSHGAQGVPVPVDVVDTQKPKPNVNSRYDTTTTTTTMMTATAEDDDCISFRNFELGVLFISHVMDPKKKNKKKNVTKQQAVDAYRTQRKQRLYCFHPQQCSCHHQPSPTTDPSRKSQVSLVHLPVPYNLCPESYFDRHHDDDDDDDEWPTTMKETPFFHSILPSSRSVGNMLLTPFGRQQQRPVSEQCWMDMERPSKRPNLG